MRMIVMMVMPVQHLGAAHKGVQPLQPMNQTLFQQEIQGPIHGGWRRLGATFLELIEQRIGADGRFRIKHQAQHFAAQGGQLHPAPLAKRIRFFQ